MNPVPSVFLLANRDGKVVARIRAGGGAATAIDSTDAVAGPLRGALATLTSAQLTLPTQERIPGRDGEVAVLLEAPVLPADARWPAALARRIESAPGLEGHVLLAWHGRGE
ncbi:hypothetical protein LBMAG42_56510 [Deltaproteobacteria bacterium]|nr:hypothetical protein LBMAG42_56510 [Deltaproteobacteria bacterium]